MEVGHGTRETAFSVRHDVPCFACEAAAGVLVNHVRASWLNLLASGLDFLGILLLSLCGFKGNVGDGGERAAGENPPESSGEPEAEEEEGESGERVMRAFGDVGLWSEIGEDVIFVVNTGGGTRGARPCIGRELEEANAAALPKEGKDDDVGRKLGAEGEPCEVQSMYCELSEGSLDAVRLWATRMSEFVLAIVVSVSCRV